MTFEEWWDSYDEGALALRFTPKELAREAWKLGEIGARTECERVAEKVAFDTFFEGAKSVDPRELGHAIKDAIYRLNWSR